MLEKTLSRTPEYLVALHILSEDFNSQEITVHWTTSVKWQTNSGRNMRIIRDKSHTFTEDSGSGVLIHPTPSSQAILYVRVKINSWVVCEKSWNRKRERSPEELSTQTKRARISMGNMYEEEWASYDPEDDPDGQSYSPDYNLN